MQYSQAYSRRIFPILHHLCQLSSLPTLLFRLFQFLKHFVSSTPIRSSILFFLFLLFLFLSAFPVQVHPRTKYPTPIILQNHRTDSLFRLFSPIDCSSMERRSRLMRGVLVYRSAIRADSIFTLDGGDWLIPLSSKCPMSNLFCPFLFFAFL